MCVGERERVCVRERVRESERVCERECVAGSGTWRRRRGTRSASSIASSTSSTLGSPQEPRHVGFEVEGVGCRLKDVGLRFSVRC